jgi:hypothetical protein
MCRGDRAEQSRAEDSRGQQSSGQQSRAEDSIVEGRGRSTLMTHYSIAHLLILHCFILLYSTVLQIALLSTRVEVG